MFVYLLYLGSLLYSECIELYPVILAAVMITAMIGVNVSSELTFASSAASAAAGDNSEILRLTSICA
jgi:hypothetical protein